VKKDVAELQHNLNQIVKIQPFRKQTQSWLKTNSTPMWPPSETKYTVCRDRWRGGKKQFKVM